MILNKRPYLIVPKLIVQPTWGGRYISELKDWDGLSFLKEKKIGQSYELFSKTKLLININDSSDKNFFPELGNPDSDEIENKNVYRENIDYTVLDNVTNKVKQIPLIKINQSNGNSFQIHIKENEKDKRWKPKMESWHYLENGLATLGLKKNINIKEYKNACLIINNQMQLLSKQIVGKEISLEIGKDRAKEFIKKVNPWQYVNLVVIKKDQVVDSGDGGIQHSWEEDLEKFPYGNVLYEVQQDVMDPISTIRCFDKGKFKKDGSIREIHIEDYFKYIDSVNEDNDINKMLLINKEKRLISKKYYSLDKLEIEKEIIDNTNNSFVHLFVREGKVEIIAENGKVILSKGHSCFIPEFVKSYKIRALNNKSIILKTTV